ncbi:hypothetical protein ACLMJK_002820 [Lecanora helva]
MIRKKIDGQVSWLFPQSFEFILESQQKDGTWESYATTVDGILNTLASFLALLVHSNSDISDLKHDEAISTRIHKARDGITSLLREWVVEDNMQVGSEVLIPNLLRQIENYGYRFTFPGRARLNQLHETKLKRFKPEAVYSKAPTTILHSLEAFIGLLNFDKVSHHCSDKLGVFGSPAATAAYLINTSTWDERAESYLKTVFSDYGSSGGVPSAYPTSLFEILWALSSLLPRVVALHDLDANAISTLSSCFKRILKDQQGVLGFAPNILEDSDDTARALLTLSHLGNRIDPIPMIERFKSSMYFKTYPFERDPSFSANCNALMAILHSSSVDESSPLIGQMVAFLVERWASGKASDKWNLSPFYSSMLLLDTLVLLLEKYDDGLLQNLPISILEQDLPLTVCQIVSRVLRSQHEDGSWKHCIEETSYCMISIARCLDLPWDHQARLQIVECYNRARCYLLSVRIEHEKLNRLWIEKVTYGSLLLRTVYYLAALKFPIEDPRRWKQGLRSFEAPQGSKNVYRLLSKVPLFRGRPITYAPVALIEAGRFADRLRGSRQLIFPRDELPLTEDKYLTFIPVLWTACNLIENDPLSSRVLWDMILLSMLNYQIDEYMETIVQCQSQLDVANLRSLIRKGCGLGDQKEIDQNQVSIHDAHESSPNLQSPPPGGSNQNKRKFYSIGDNSRVSMIIVNYFNHILQHSAALRSSPSTRSDLALEVHNFLLAHIVQNLDNNTLRASKQSHLPSPSQTSAPFRKDYFEWVQSTAADNTSCPFSFLFFTVLINIDAPGLPLFEGPRAKYLSQSLARHLAVMCRQYNDFGFAARDANEGNLNSLDFGEFAVESSRTKIEYGEHQANPHDKPWHSSERGSAARLQPRTGKSPYKEELLRIADFERACMELAFKELENEMRSISPTSSTRTGANTMKALRVFINVTDLFGQIYVQKDIASRLKNLGGGK